MLKIIKKYGFWFGYIENIKYFCRCINYTIVLPKLHIMKKPLLLFFALLVACTLFATPISTNTAVELANRFIKSNQLAMEQVSIDNLAYTEFSTEGSPVYYVFNLNDDGFIIVSAEDFTLPILGYSTENEFDKDNIPVNMADILSDYKSEVQFAQEKGLVVNAEILSAREDQLNNVSQYRSSVAPLLGDIKWDQSPYYNALCPVYNNYGSRVPVGCVATAMAQIMRYWKYPAHGQGSHSYNHSTYGNQYANFDVDYDWDAMPAATLTAPNAECAKISYHCAVSIDMQFGPNGSGAYQQDCPYSYINYFKYKNTTRNAERSKYNATNWANLVKGELDAGRPVQYAGSGTGGGHSFVCDGYNENGYFHFNWGWGGSSDGYFLLNALNPGSLGTGGGSGGFNSYQTIVIGIEPDENVTPPTPPTPPTPITLEVPTGLYANDITVNSAVLGWNAVENATSYNVEFRKSGDSWSSYNIAGTSANATGLSANTVYEWRVQAVNSSTSSDFSQVESFTTLDDNGGGGGTPVEYCASSATTSYYEWISRFVMANVDNYSCGSQYGDYTDQIVNVAKGQTLPIYFKSGYRGYAYYEYWTVWIDYNHDGEFSDDEMVVRGYGRAGWLLKSNITISNTALLGETRLRISMKYGNYSGACETFYYGEVEDYTVNITSSNAMQFAGNDPDEAAFALSEGMADVVSIYPNPATDRIQVDMTEIRGQEAPYTVIDMQGRVILKGNLMQTNEIDISKLSNGSYFLSIETEPGTILKFVKE